MKAYRGGAQTPQVMCVCVDMCVWQCVNVCARVLAAEDLQQALMWLVGAGCQDFPQEPGNMKHFEYLLS